MNIKSPLSYYRLDIRIVATEKTFFDAWLGAVIRNNLLYATEQVKLESENLTLYKQLNLFPLKTQHPFYSELKNGFPLPYYLFVNYPLFYSDKYAIEEQKMISFSLVLIGSISNYYKEFVEAIRFMCKRGFGINMKPFELVDVHEVSHNNEKKIVATTHDFIAPSLSYPICLDSFIDQLSTKTDKPISFNFQTPVCLIKNKIKINSQTSYQDKISEFPSFYQIVKSSLNRLVKLNILYAIPEDIEYCQTIENELDKLINNATNAVLDHAEINRVKLVSTRRENDANRITFAGYVGNLRFSGSYKPYLPILKFMENLGIGHDLVYGLGKFKVE